MLCNIERMFEQFEHVIRLMERKTSFWGFQRKFFFLKFDVKGGFSYVNVNLHFSTVYGELLYSPQQFFTVYGEFLYLPQQFSTVCGDFTRKN